MNPTGQISFHLYHNLNSMTFFRTVWAILYKDILMELRTKETLSSMFVFALLVIVIFNFAFEAGRSDITLIGPGILWIAFTFAGTLGLNHAFALEKENNCLNGMMLTPLDRGDIYLGKFLGTALFMFIMEILILPFFSLLFNISLLAVLPQLLLINLLGTAGFCGVGTILSAVAANTRLREVLLPIMLFPVLVPLLIGVVESTAILLQDSDSGGYLNWVKILTVFDVVFIVVSYWMFGHILEE